jgi:hypothetical protein
LEKCPRTERSHAPSVVGRQQGSPNGPAALRRCRVPPRAASGPQRHDAHDCGAGLGGHGCERRPATPCSQQKQPPSVRAMLLAHIFGIPVEETSDPEVDARPPDSPGSAT